MAKLEGVYIAISNAVRQANSLPCAEQASYKSIVDALSAGTTAGLNNAERAVYHNFKEQYDTRTAQFKAYYQYA